MLAVLEELKLTELVTSITGLSAIGAASILAETETRDASRPLGRWSTTPAWPHERSCRAPSRAAPNSPAKADPDYDSPPGGGLGSPTSQPRLCSPLHLSDHPRDEQAESPASPRRHRRRDPATPARRHQHRPTMGPLDRHPRHQPTTDHPHRCLDPQRSEAGSGRAPRGIETPR